MGQIITFYSYKGGVGRSMALANVGHIMAWQMKPQRKVLMIDWDLEAPGLHKFFNDQLKANFPGGEFAHALRQAPGLVNFLHDVYGLYEKTFPTGDLSVMQAETGAAQEAFANAIAKYPLKNYVLKVAPPESVNSTTDRLFLLKAGNQASDNFVNMVRTFPWQAFFDRFGSFFTLFCEYLAAEYDTVLIDSRTGLTDIGDICTCLMPEKLVGIFVPNEQNIEGLIGVMRSSAEFRKNSRDPRGMTIFPLASRIDPSRGQLRRAWWKGGESLGRKIKGYEPQFESLVASIYDLEECDLESYFDVTQVPHDSDYAFGEEVAARDPSSGHLGIAYSCANLAQYLLDDRVPWEPLPQVPEESDNDQILASRRVRNESSFRWFLSYHTPDQAMAERLKAAIERKDAASRVFFAPSNLRAGGAWTAQLAEELAKADVFVLLIGEHGVGKWQVPEYDEALDRWAKAEAQFPLIVVLLEGQSAPGLPFLRRMHWIVTPDPASEKNIAFDAASGGGVRPLELWRYVSPYRGLEAMEEKDSDYFFGGTRETLEALDSLVAPARLLILIGNSGVGKSSLAQAGVLAALKRQAWPENLRASNAWPTIFQNSRQWCFLTLRPGAEPLKALVDCFLDNWQYAATDPERSKRQVGWIHRLLQGEATLSDLIEATDRRREELDQPKPPAFFLYIDQGEELYVRAEERQRRRFSELLAQALPDPRLRVMTSLRSGFLGSLQSDAPLFSARLQIDVPPLGEEELREVVSRPAQLLGARFETEKLIDIIARRAAEDSVKDVGALPLLSYALDDMWTEMLRAGDGVLRLQSQRFELGGVLVDRANRFLVEHPGAEDALRRVFTLKLATVREDGEPTRRRAIREEFSDEEWRLVSELSGYPNRLVVTVTTEAAETYAEVAHEAIFRRWDKLREWIAAERDFLTWRSGLEGARRSWEKTPKPDKNEALLMGFALTQAQNWLARRSGDLPQANRTFIVESRKQARRRNLRGQALVGALVAVMAASVLIWWYQNWLREEIFALANRRKEENFRLMSATALNLEQERALKPGDSFKECSGCPEMVVVPAGRFKMGSPAGQGYDSERPQHEVTIAKPFAVAKAELTFDAWDACAMHVSDVGWGRGPRPAINVSWHDAQTYVKWLFRITGKQYRLLSGAEYEYAARAGTRTAYPWGDEIGKGEANCNGCGSKWDGKLTAPVGSFAANSFGLYDMVGNVWEWTDDCWNPSYQDAPADGSPWTSGDCSVRVIRGGSWINNPSNLRSAFRTGSSAGSLGNDRGFRVARTLTDGSGANAAGPAAH
jgi:formylglycine-generating enzyme required for sulfatase activity